MAIIFLILAAIYITRRPKIKGMHPNYYSHVPTQDFERWQRQEILSIDIFLAACLFAAVLTTAVPFAIVLTHQTPDFNNSPLAAVPMISLAVGVVGFFVGLIVSAVFGSMAASLKKKLSIELPK